LKTVWAATMLLILGTLLFDLATTSHSYPRYEVRLKFTLLMNVVSIPLGFAAMAVWGRAKDTFGMPSPVLEDLAVWTLCCIASYLQWFVLVPHLFRTLRERFHPTTSGNTERAARQ